MSLYQQLEDCEKTFFDWRNTALRFACCDCGLVHDIVFQPNGAKSYVMFVQNNRSTGQVRRYMPSRKTDECAKTTYDCDCPHMIALDEREV